MERMNIVDNQEIGRLLERTAGANKQTGGEVMRGKLRRKSILRLAAGMRQEPRSATLGPKEEISELQINGQGEANRRRD